MRTKKEILDEVKDDFNEHIVPVTTKGKVEFIDTKYLDYLKLEVLIDIRDQLVNLFYKK